MRTLTDTSSFDDPITVIADGEPLDSSHIGGGGAGQASQGLANRTRWLKNQIGAANGLATLDGSSRLVQLPKNAILGAVRIPWSGGNVLTTTSSTFADVPGAVINSSTLAALLTLLAGDIVFFDAMVTLFCSLAQNVACKLQYFENAGSWTDESGISVFGPPVGSESVPCMLSGAHVVGTGGAFGIKLQGKAADNSTSSEVHLDSMRLWVVRP